MAIDNRTERSFERRPHEQARVRAGTRGGWLGVLALFGLVAVGCASSSVAPTEPEVHGAAPSVPTARAAPEPPPTPPVPAPPAAPSLELDAPLPTDPAVVTGRLENGLTYFVRRNTRPEARAELRLAINAGSILEDDDQLGLAHFLEHMAFNGTTHFEKQELVDYLESIGTRFGADLNAYTSFDETVYMLQVPTDDREMVEKSLLVLADWAGEITLDPEEIDKERGVVLEEWRLGRGAGARVSDQQLPVILHGSRYAERLPIGEPEVLRSFEPATVERFYRDWYRPDLMAVIAVGDFDVEEMEQRIVDVFSTLSNPESPRERFESSVPDHEETLTSTVTDPELTVSQVSVLRKYPLPIAKTVEDYRQGLVEGLFTAMLNARFSELVQAADPPFLGGGASDGGFTRETGAYSLGAAVEAGGVERGFEALATEAARVRQHGFNESELDRMRASFLRSYQRMWEEREKTESRAYASEYVRVFLEQESYPGIDVERQMAERYLPTVTAEEVAEVGERFLGDANRVLLMTAPDSAADSLPDPETVLAIVDRVEAESLEPWADRTLDAPLLTATPTPSPVVEEAEISELGTTVWQLENGIRVLLKPTDFKNDEIRFTSFSAGGSSLVPDEEWVSALASTSVVGLSGFGSFDAIELQKKLSGKVASVSPFIGELSEGLSGGGSPEDIELLFQLIYLTATQPRCDEEAFGSFKTRMRGFLENQREQPEVVFSQEVQRALSQDHYRRRPMDEELLEEAELEEACAIFRDRFADLGDLTFVMVGAFDLDTVRPLVETYLGGLPTDGRQENWRDLGVRKPQGVIERQVEKGIEAKSRVQLVFNGPFEQDVQNRYDLQSMATLLQIRLRERLREDMGGTYGVSVGASNSWEPIQEYQVGISFECEPSNVEALTEAVFEEIARLVAEGASELDLTKIKEQQRRGRETALRTNGFWLSTLAYAEQYETDPLSVLSFQERVDALTSADIQEAVARYLNPENYVRVVLMPGPEAARGPAPDAGSEGQE